MTPLDVALESPIVVLERRVVEAQYGLLRALPAILVAVVDESVLALQVYLAIPKLLEDVLEFLRVDFDPKISYK